MMTTSQASLAMDALPPSIPLSHQAAMLTPCVVTLRGYSSHVRDDSCHRSTRACSSDSLDSEHNDAGEMIFAFDEESNVASEAAGVKQLADLFFF